ncbi:MAG: ribosome biogenesis GTPase Der, partial [Myxococcota bacterium]
HDRPGVTRDRNYETAAWQDRSYLLVDTVDIEPDARPQDVKTSTRPHLGGGLAMTPGETLFAAMRAQVGAAVEEADVVVLLVDRQAGITPADKQIAEMVRASGKPVVVAANKCDFPTHDDEAHDFWGLGFQELVPVSAEHGRGVFELMEAVSAHFPEETAPEPEDEREIRIAVLGRPNVGKSTLLNRLIGENRHVVDDAPGTTVDATDSVMEYEGQRFRLVDTAGIRRRARIDDPLESLMVGASIRTIERCHIVMLVLDGAEGVTEQDAHLAALVEERGRGLVVLVNKWDQVREIEDRNIRTIEDEFSRKLPHVAFAPVLYISALTGKGTQKVLAVARDVFGAFNQRVSTARLNEFLRDAVANNNPPQRHHHPVRLNYMTQVRVRPPTFTVFCNTPEGMVESYDRYLQNRLREQFGFFGSPLRIQYRRKRRPGEAKEDLNLPHHDEQTPLFEAYAVEGEDFEDVEE